MSEVPRRLRQQVIARAENVCEYCRNQQAVMLVPFEADHIIPSAHDGATTLDNLALSCPLCNMAKATRVTGFEATTHAVVSLFNPRQQSWSDHFQWNADFTEIVGKTPTGRATVATLVMNDPHTVIMRGWWRKMRLHPPRLQGQD